MFMLKDTVFSVFCTYILNSHHSRMFFYMIFANLGIITSVEKCKGKTPSQAVWLFPSGCSHAYWPTESLTCKKTETFAGKDKMNKHSLMLILQSLITPFSKLFNLSQM